VSPRKKGKGDRRSLAFLAARQGGSPTLYPDAVGPAALGGRKKRKGRDSEEGRKRGGEDPVDSVRRHRGERRKRSEKKPSATASSCVRREKASKGEETASPPLKRQGFPLLL